MTLSSFLISFGAGVIVGVLILIVAQNIISGEDISIFDFLKRLFSFKIGGSKDIEEEPDENIKRIAEPPKVVDPREQNLYDSAQKIRSILMVMKANFQRTDQAANDSTSLLGDVKSAINLIDLPDDFNDAQSLLMKEIDRIIASNASLRDELAKSHTELTEQQHQIEELRTAVRVDGLTQLANRAYFDEKLAEMITLHERYREPFSLMMIDLDNFKMINDSFGHLAGDRILKGVALKIKASLRGSDFLARFGGDEYAAILIKTDAEAATEVAWKLCEEFRGSRFILDDTSISMTLSIGIAEVHDKDTVETLLERADSALYKTKYSGRNGVFSVLAIP